MNGLILDAKDASTAALSASLLQQGKLVVLPAETVYGIAVNLHSAAARARVTDLKQLAANPGWVVHVGSTADALRLLPNASSLARRLMTKGWPGPIALQIAVPPADLDTLKHALGEAYNQTIIDGFLTLRCPDNHTTLQILSAVPSPIAMIGATTAGDPPALTVADIPPAIADHVDAIVDAGSTRYNKTSTLVRVTGDQWQVLRAGVFDARIIARLADQLILFVCSGNTCRSPMAASIATRVLADKLRTAPEELLRRHIVIQSAGLHASRGMRATPEAQDAVRELNADLRSHSSQPVTNDLLRRADVIYTMTQDHRDEIVEALPSVIHKTHRLDPHADVEDPIGGDIATYRQVAHRLSQLVERRMAEWPV
jgi:tRNA threonylcarbamoyl adenosine modification protein (Sua5/YciO/YrdC/YwlC family)